MRLSITAFGRSPAPAESFRALSLNERQVLGLICREAPLSRAELARRTGLALPTVSRLTDQLMRDGLVMAEDKVMMGRMGQPSLPLSLAVHAAYAFGVAVRADSLTVSLTHLSGSIVSSVEEPHQGLTREQSVSRIGDAARRLAEEHKIPPDRVCGLGLALPGFFVQEPQRVNAPLGMDDWATADLERDLGSALGLPVLVENDGNAAAFGESLYGHGITCPSLAYLYIDRGLGGGVVVDGTLMRGRRGNAGEFTGLLPPDVRHDRPTLLSLREELEADGATFVDMAAMLTNLDFSAPAIDRWIARSLPTANAIVSAIAAVADPDAIVIGGRLPKCIAERLVAGMTYFTVPVRGRDRAFPALVVSTVPADAVALGAGALCSHSRLL